MKKVPNVISLILKVIANILLFVAAVLLIDGIFKITQSIDWLPALVFLAVIIVLAIVIPRQSRNFKKIDVLEEVVDIKQGRNYNPKTNIGKWYLRAFIAVALFPIIGWIIGKFVDSAKLQQNILLILGYMMIISFIVGIVITGRRRSKDKNTKT